MAGGYRILSLAPSGRKTVLIFVSAATEPSVCICVSLVRSLILGHVCFQETSHCSMEELNKPGICFFSL